ncbi:ATP-binding protein [Desulforamulus hydrothermalis]|uniref:AAA+ ATPase domain-containing protein n=1 Tax=Desulforamulus hydrothermalis Lam5 = DSM 18033 TaxID=1121428 RepID=K8DYR8_9FIRM|nr:ATP-binding protein [Desulforamulus hydrothermalis]CCO08034.1 conserved hypothetical protein [Desulforamulus hydrothermalis Lam5 = DSM 18033]SHG83632.1 hypothetical protein SAMN02745177_00517 [Desulforamulus hydrothermalis Lam5 = DSM 18033]
MHQQLTYLDQALSSLVLWRGITGDPAVQCFQNIVQAASRQSPTPAGSLLPEYSRLAGLLTESSVDRHLPPAGNPWQNHLLNLILFEDHRLARQAAAGQDIAPLLQDAFRHDLSQLQAVCRQGLADLEKIFHNCPGLFPLSGYNCHFSGQGSHPAWGRFLELKQKLLSSPHWPDLFSDFLSFYQQVGFGRFARYWAFRWEATAAGYRLVGIEEPDAIRLHQLVGYELQRKQVLDNTERLLAGQPAHNLLLYGDRGTGKSSTVKALLHRYGHRGLRLIQVPRHSLGGLQQLTANLRKTPLKFIIFIDDLSFEETETEYKEFKTQLEGSLEQPPSHICIYVTSNQRNLIKEYFGERTTRVADSGEVHPGDTMQEKLSLVDRFGLKITFMAPDKEEYLKIVRHLAAQEGIRLAPEVLERMALQWTLWHSERSGRTARQFVDHIKDREDLNIF